MTAAVLRFVLDHWREALIAVGVLAAFGYCHERDRRIAEEARREVYVQRFTEALASLDSLEAEKDSADQRADSALAELGRERRAADSLRAIVRAQAEEAGRDLARAGDSIEATLDSIRNAETLEDAHRLAEAGTEQVEALRDAHQRQVSAWQRERQAYARLLANADSATEVERRKNERLEAVNEAQGRALREARSAVGARAPSGDSWGSRALIAGGFAALGYGLAQVW